jgi:formate dehydrogenase subunit delta
MDANRLVIMANQIATFFAAQGAGAEAAVADHIVKNWDPRMKSAIAAHVAAGGAGLDPLAKSALETIAAKAA